MVCSDGVDEGALSDARGERSGPTCGAVGLLEDVVLGPLHSSADHQFFLGDRVPWILEFHIVTSPLV
eukprot:scaffold25813_cov30-Phaeocystis_antarctica.AAC.1